MGIDRISSSELRFLQTLDCSLGGAWKLKVLRGRVWILTHLEGLTLGSKEQSSKSIMTHQTAFT